MGNVIKGWKPASRFSGGIPVRTLRKAVLDERTLKAAKQDGAWTFEATDLLAFAAAHGKKASSGIAPAIATPEVSSTARATSPTSSAPPLGPIPSWLVAAAARCEREDVAVAHDGDEDEEDVASHQPPFWAVDQAPAYADGEPYVDATTHQIRYRPASPASGPHTPGTTGAVLAERQEQLAATQAQLATAQRELEAGRSENTRWAAAWRAERIRARAAQEALQAAMHGGSPELLHAITTTAAQALAGLSDEQLRDDGQALHAARVAGMHAAQIAAAWAANAYDGGPNDDVARARARRRQRRW